jgi:phosphate acetyltransferase
MSDSRQHQKYDALIARCRTVRPVTVAVVHPCDEVSLRAAVDAAQARIITPVLVGPAARITALAATIGVDVSGFRLVDAPHSHAAAALAVALVRAGDAQALMKGSLHTDELLEEVVRPDTGLRTQRRLSHVFIMDVPTYYKPLFITDAAVNIRPTLEQKADIAQNAIDLAHALGIAQPKVAILSAVETVSSKLPSTVDAAALCKMAERGQITGALLDGPLALDNAISPKPRASSICRRPSPATPTSCSRPISKPATCSRRADVPRQRRCGRHRARRARAGDPDEPRRQRAHAARELRDRGAGRGRRAWRGVPAAVSPASATPAEAAVLASAQAASR